MWIFINIDCRIVNPFSEGGVTGDSFSADRFANFPLLDNSQSEFAADLLIKGPCSG